MSASGSSRKGTAKLSELLEIERQIQDYWNSEHLFEENAPTDGSRYSSFLQFLISRYK